MACANPPGREEQYNGFELNASDVALAAKQLVGKPLLIEHKGNPVGTIDDAWVAKDGRLLVMGKTDNSSVRGLYARNMIIDGGYPEVSLGSVATVDPERLRVTGKQYKEVSIVERGLREGTTIDSRTRTSRRSYKTHAVPVCCSLQAQNAAMSTTQAEEAAAPPPVQSQEPTSQSTDQQKEPTPVQTGASAAKPAEPSSLGQRVAGLSHDEISKMTNEELMARVAALQAENKWYVDKTKRSYDAAFDAATQKFLTDLKTEDEAGKQAFIQSLRALQQDPTVGGREANAVMEVAVAASRQHQQQQQTIEDQLQELKRLRTGGGLESKSSTNNSKPTNFANTNARSAPQPVAASNNVPPAAHSSSAASNGAGNPMWDWLKSGQKGQGMERMDYSHVAGKDFTQPAQAYNQM